jgi:hypothetical protein
MSDTKRECNGEDVRNAIGLVFMAVLLGVSGSLPAQAIPRPAQAECPGDTVDRMGVGIAKESRDFLGKLSDAVERGDKKQVASMVHYPISVHSAEKTVVIHNPEEFVRDYGHLMNDSVKAKITDKKSSRCLFANSQGFMVGDGEVWFKEFSRGVFKIIAFNLGGSPSGDPPKP